MQLANARFERDGFALLPQLLSATARLQLNALTPRILQRAQDWQARGADLWFLQDDFPELAQILNDPSLTYQLRNSSGFTDTRFQLFAVTLYCKRPEEPGTAWHQDARFIPSDLLSALTLWLPLQAIDVANAPLQFLPGSQQHCLLMQPQPASERPHGILDATPIVVAAPMAFGDATIHAPWTLHGARRNRTGTNRYALIVNYLCAPIILNNYPELVGSMHPAVVNQLRCSNHFTILRRLERP
jgi:hypothetical protein